MKKVIVIVGPTGSGKTKNSVQLAKELNAEIINGDSVQIYKELNIGSAKIKENEKEDIPHHLFDIRNVGESYSSFDFQKDVRNLINKIEIPIIVGGTGYYIKSALYNYEFDKESNNLLHEELSNEQIYSKLKQIDNNIDIDKNNRVRLIRAYNLALSGNLRSEKNKSNQALYDILPIYLDLDRKVLKELLIQRLDIMIEEGLIFETEQLIKENHELNIIGYREITKYLKGNLTLNQAKEEIIKVSMRLAKKQKTWFKNQMNCVFVNPLDKNVGLEIFKIVKEFLGGIK